MRQVGTLTADAATLRAAKGGARLIVTAHAANLQCADGILQSKAGVALLKKLGDAGTTRNWATVLKLQDLVNAAG